MNWTPGGYAGQGKMFWCALWQKKYRDEKMMIKNRKGLSFELLIGIVLLAVFLLIILMAYINMEQASGAINASVEGNLSRLTDISAGIE